MENFKTSAVAEFPRVLCSEWHDEPQRHAFVQSVHTVCATLPLVAAAAVFISRPTVLVLQYLLLLSPKHNKSSDAGSSKLPERSLTVLSSGDKGNVLDFLVGVYVWEKILCLSVYRDRCCLGSRASIGPLIAQ